MLAWMRAVALAAALGAGGVAAAGEADVVGVAVERTAPDTYSFTVTVRHADAGWDHYADRWQVLSPDGTMLGERVLLHPHDNEQPFTRSLSGVVIDSGIEEVTVRAGDLLHGFGGVEKIVRLPSADS